MQGAAMGGYGVAVVAGAIRESTATAIGAAALTDDDTK